MKNEVQFLAALVSDYANMLHEQGHQTAAKVVTQQANAAVAALNSSDQRVPEESHADHQNT